MLTALLLSVLPAVGPLRGDPFTELGFDAALAQAQKEKKLLLVDFTASWCPPCKKMEKDTWAAENVRAWLKDNALALQIDVDHERELSKRFQIEAMPTVIAFRDGAEFDRVVGYKDAAQFLAWAGDVRAGKRASDGLLERSKGLRESQDVDERYDLARDLLRARQYDEALAHYLWLWPATRGASGMGGVRLSYMLSDMAELAKKHEPARKAFEGIFAELQAKVDAPGLPTFQDWSEWSAFCDNFGAPARMVAWYEQRRDPQGQLFAGQHDFLPDHIVSEVFDVLLAAKRPLDAARLYADARPRAQSFVEEHRTFVERIGEGQEEWRISSLAHDRERLIERMSKLHAAMLLGERREEATDVARLLLETLDTPESRQELVRQGLYVAKKADPSFARWLDEAEAAGADVKHLRKKLAQLEAR